MNPTPSDRVALTLFGCWMVLVVANAIFLFTSRNAALKRRVASIGVFFVTLLLSGFILLMRQAWLLLIVLPALALGVTVNARRMRFCDACGATNLLANPFRSEAFCSNCGKPLDLKRSWF